MKEFKLVRTLFYWENMYVSKYVWKRRKHYNEKNELFIVRSKFVIHSFRLFFAVSVLTTTIFFVRRNLILFLRHSIKEDKTIEKERAREARTLKNKNKYLYYTLLLLMHLRITIILDERGNYYYYVSLS